MGRPKYYLCLEQQKWEGFRVWRLGVCKLTEFVFNRFDSACTPCSTFLTHQSTDPGRCHPLWHIPLPSFRTLGTSASSTPFIISPLYTPPPPQMESLSTLTADQVRRKFMNIKMKQATGPDGNSRLVMDCDSDRPSQEHAPDYSSEHPGFAH